MIEETPQITFRSDMDVEMIKCSATDADVIWAARVSTAGEQSLNDLDADAERSEGLIRYLLRSRHGTPFEHGSFTFYVSAPIFVFREFMRHRVGFSYNEESARYRELDPIFYMPSQARPIVQEGKPGHYRFTAGSDKQANIVVKETTLACLSAYSSYRAMLDAGVAREVARGVLPVAIFSSMYVTCNPRSLMSLISLRVHNEDAAYPSYPQREIEMVAEQMEAFFADAMPLTHKAFVEYGRVSP